MRNKITKKSLIILGLFGIFLSSSVFAKELAKKNPKHSETPMLMNQFLEQLTSLKKYFVSEDKFTDPKNNLEITTFGINIIVRKTDGRKIRKKIVQQDLSG